MAELDRVAINRFGIPGLVLMENAALKVVQYIKEIYPDPQRGRVIIFCGKGNNGGDGFVIARHLLRSGYRCYTWAMDRSSAYQGDAAVNYEILLKQGIPVQLVTEDDPAEILKELGKDDLVIDALLGTGLKREVSHPFAGLIGAINDSPAPTLAVDIPSGVSADSGEIMGVAVKAEHTVTFAYPKRGLLLYPGASCAGRVVVADIGIPRCLPEAAEVRENYITAQLVQSLLPTRPAQSHKGTYGRALVLAGSPGMTGAAVLTAEAALRGGAGLVYLGAAPELRPVLESKLKEVIIRELPGDGEGNLDVHAFTRIQEEALNCQSLAVGPGLSPGHATLTLVQQILEQLPLPQVIDAGGLGALAQNPSILQQEKKNTPVLTPHPGEMAGLLGIDAGTVQRQRWELTAAQAREWNCVLVLKGAHTVIGLPSGEVYINPTGNASLATAGSGDVLTGLITAMLAQGTSSKDGALAGVYVHGLAADIMVTAEGLRGHAAGDLLSFLAAAFQQVNACNTNMHEEFVLLKQ